MDTNGIEILRETSVEQLSDDQLDQIVGGVGNVIASTYHKGDGNGEAAFYAGICMGLMGLLIVETRRASIPNGARTKACPALWQFICRLSTCSRSN